MYADTTSQEEDRRPLAYFQAVHSAFLAAEQRGGGSVDRFYTVAGRTIHLRFAGPNLVPHLTPPLAHLAVDADRVADFTVCVWDSASTRTPLPEVRLTLREQARSSAKGNDTRRIRTSFQGALGAEGGLRAVSLLDAAQRLAVHWVPSADAISPWDRAGPLLVILYWILDIWGIQVAHAGAVGTEKGGALLTGKAGSGKSTTTLACLEFGLSFAGDDVVALSTQSRPEAWSLYSSARLNPDSLELLPAMAQAVSNPDRVHEDKALILLHDHYPGQLRTRLPIDAIIVPQVTGAPDSRLVPTSRAATFAALAPTSMFQVPDADQRAFRTLADFVRRVPSYGLEIGKDSSSVPHLISELLAETDAGTRE